MPQAKPWSAVRFLKERCFIYHLTCCLWFPHRLLRFISEFDKPAEPPAILINHSVSVLRCLLQTLWNPPTTGRETLGSLLGVHCHWPILGSKKQLQLFFKFDFSWQEQKEFSSPPTEPNLNRKILSRYTTTFPIWKSILHASYKLVTLMLQRRPSQWT